MPNVAVIVPDRASVFELAVPCEVFGIDRSDIVSPWYGFRVLAVEDPPLRTTAGFTIDTPYRLADLGWADTVIVPAWPASQAFAADQRGGSSRRQTTDPPDDRPAAALLDALRGAHDRGARIVGICTGAFVLAAAGLLDGRRATTHWMHADALAARYPRVRVDPAVLYVDEGRVLTSAGTAAGIDLCLHLVRCDHGAQVANAVARRMVVAPQRDGGQAQYVEAPVPWGDANAPIGPLLAWMGDHLGEAHTVEGLARRAAMSTRTFARRFRAVTGTTPHGWISQQRVLLAQQLLETSDASVEQVAARCGLGTAANLRKHFRRILGTTPLAYRRTFQRVA